MEFYLRHYLRLQMEEIDEHKWFLSEKEGRDVGYERAIYDWINTGHAERFQKAYMEHLRDCEELAEMFEDTMIPRGLVHDVLRDTDPLQIQNSN